MELYQAFAVAVMIAMGFILSHRNVRHSSFPFVIGAVLCGVVLAGRAETTDLATQVDQYVRSTCEVDAARRLQQILSHEDLRDADDRAFQRLAAVLAQPRPMYPVPGPNDTREIGGGLVERVVFELPDGREMSAILRLPPNYTSAQRWPLIIAMHGGPLRTPEEAVGSAFRFPGQAQSRPLIPVTSRCPPPAAGAS